MHRHNNRLRSTHRERPCFWHEFNYFYRDQTEFKWSLQVSRSRSKAGARGEAYFISIRPTLSFLSLSLLARIPLWKRSRSTRLFEEVRYHSIGKFQYGGLRNFRFTSFHKEEVDAAAIYAASLSLLEARKRATTTAGEGGEKRRQARAFALRSNAWNVTMRN